MPFTWEQARELTVLAEERGVRIGGVSAYVFRTGAAADQTAFRAGSHRTAALLKRGDDVLRSGNVASGAGSVLPGRGRAALRYGAGLYNCCRGLVWTCCGDQSHGGNRIEKRKIYGQPLAGEELTVETPTHYTALLKLSGGLIANLTVSFDIWRRLLCPTFEIYGTEGTLSAPDPNMSSGMPEVTRKETALAEGRSGRSRAVKPPAASPMKRN